jgi:hypothetical protein
MLLGADQFFYSAGVGISSTSSVQQLAPVPFPQMNMCCPNFVFLHDLVKPLNGHSLESTAKCNSPQFKTLGSTTSMQPRAMQVIALELVHISHSSTPTSDQDFQVLMIMLCTTVEVDFFS